MMEEHEQNPEDRDNDGIDEPDPQIFSLGLRLSILRKIKISSNGTPNTKAIAI